MNRLTHFYYKNIPSCAGKCDKKVTFAKALSFLFSDDMHPSSGTSRNTIESYKITFRLFMHFLEQHRPESLQPDIPVEMIDSSLVREFLKYLSEERECSPQTINVRKAAFSAIACSLLRRYPQLSSYCLSIIAIKGYRAKEPLIGYFELNELKAIFETVDTSTPDGFRNLVLLRCLYNTGARASEICNLRMEDLRLDEPAHMVLRGKGGKVRTAPLWQVTSDLLRAYIAVARRKARTGYEDFVFINRRGRVLTRHGLYRIARTYIEKAARTMPRLNRKELHPICSFRHTTATHLLMAGESLTVIQEILGHARIDTTQRYRAVSIERKRMAIQRLLELRNRKPEQSEAAAGENPAWTDSSEAIDWLERL